MRYLWGIGWRLKAISSMQNTIIVLWRRRLLKMVRAQMKDALRLAVSETTKPQLRLGTKSQLVMAPLMGLLLGAMKLAKVMRLQPRFLR
tara:strand:+ start:1032 stop:1298 length:267 start_codon:yes stop_codon:yes gene_type:complete